MRNLDLVGETDDIFVAHGANRVGNVEVLTKP